METQFPYLPAEVTGVWLTEILGMLSQEADEEIGPAEVAVGELLEPGPHFGLDFNRYRSAMHSIGICT